MNKEYDIIIIGAGPAGLFAGASIKSGRKALILEKNNSAGKKLLMSGSGRCNITQSGPVAQFTEHYGGAGRFIKPALMEFSNADLINFLNVRGMPTIERKGKIFPATENASDVLNILLKECKSMNTGISYNEPVAAIQRDGQSFIITPPRGSYSCPKALIATGGRSYPTTGSTGDGYMLAQSLGHTLEKPKPALTPVFIEDFKFAGISGVSIYSSKISLLRQGKLIHTSMGDIGFTHKGLTGPGILDMSRFIEAGDLLKVNLINQNPEFFRESINSAAISSGRTTIKRYLKAFALPESLIRIILEEQKTDTGARLAEISKNTRQRLAGSLCGYEFSVNSTGGFNIAMATKGGVSLKEVSPKTMQSRIVPNLFFAGEVLDIDGDTGGYNIQAAFSTGRMAAKSF